jgi:Male sterility protein
LTKIQKKIHTVMLSTKLFVTVSYKMEIANMEKMFEELSDVDKQRFNFDVNSVNIPLFSLSTRIDSLISNDAGGNL